MAHFQHNFYHSNEGNEAPDPHLAAQQSYFKSLQYLGT
jgi:hypothetical protein